MLDYKQIEQKVEQIQGQTVEFLQAMIQAPSENPPGDYRQAAEVIARIFKEWGMEVSIIETPEYLVREAGLKGPRLNVFGKVAGKEPGPALILCGHLDTVPAGSIVDWQRPPFSGEISGERIWGRGAVDCKGRVAAYAAAAKVLLETKLLKKGELVVAATCDEETGGRLGAGYLVKEGILKGDYAIVEGYSDRIVRAMSGVLWCDLKVRGKAAHAAYKERGINAIEQMRLVLEVLSNFEKELQNEPSQIPGIKYTTLNVGAIQGGSKPNVVAENCMISIDLRIMPEHSLQEIYRRLENKLEPLKEQGINWELIPKKDLWTAPTLAPETTPVLDALINASRIIKGRPLPVVGVPIQSDAKYFLEAGIPAINFGPGRPENGIHGLNEYLEIKDLMESIKVLTLASAELLGEG